MPTNVNYQVPFLPQEGITAQILHALQLANEHHVAQQQLGIQQQQANTGQQAVQQQAPEIAARTKYLGAETESLIPSIPMKDVDGKSILIAPAHVPQVMGSGFRYAGTMGSAAIHAGAGLEEAHIKADSAEAVAKIKAQTQEQYNEILSSYNKGKLGQMMLAMKIKGLAVQDQTAYHEALIPILQETADARDTAAKSGDIKALSDARSKFGWLSEAAGLFGFNDVQAAATDELQKTIPSASRAPAKPAAQTKPPQTKGFSYARDPQGKLHQAPTGTPLPAGWTAQ